MRMAAAELFQLALKLHDWFGNGRCALSPAQDQPSSPADSTYQAQLNGVTHACRKLTTFRRRPAPCAAEIESTSVGLCDTPDANQRGSVQSAADIQLPA